MLYLGHSDKEEGGCIDEKERADDVDVDDAYGFHVHLLLCVLFSYSLSGFSGLICGY